jgi:hypothetical protein
MQIGKGGLWEKGKIYEIEAIGTSSPYGTKSGWE